jgi:hypothetical protein
MNNSSLDIFKNWRTYMFGALSWLLPFFAAFAFFDSSGNLTVTLPLFKSIMVVIGGTVGVVLLALFLRRSPFGIVPGLILGLIWLAMNLGLDLMFLLPMSKQLLPDYFADIGLRYLLLPVIAIGVGYAAGPRNVPS